jgi:hypothetical protein
VGTGGVRGTSRGQNAVEADSDRSAMRWSRLGRGRRKSNTVAGGPFPPAMEHTDGPPDRPRHDVPNADVNGGAPPPAKTEPDNEEEGT